MKRLAFVDDEARILEGLRRLMRSLRHEWDMEFYDSPLTALERFETAPADVVISDIRMPVMDGSQFLTEVQKRWPATVRIVLSGQCDREVVFRAVIPAHQFLTKPCNPDVLRGTLARLKELRERLINEDVRSQISALTSLPVSRRHYERLVELLHSDHATITEVAQVVASDVAMAAKVMQLVGSNFFGSQRRLCPPFQAAQQLGLDVIRTLVLDYGLFSPDALGPELAPWVDYYEELCLATAHCAQKIAEHETSDPAIILVSYLAGLFSRIGVAIFASVDPAKYRQVFRFALEDGSRPLSAIEHQFYGVVRCEAAAYLLALWGLPSEVVEAVLYADTPGKSSETTFGPVTAVHAAQYLVATSLALTRGLVPNLDEDFLKRVGYLDRLEAWRAICLETLTNLFKQNIISKLDLLQTAHHTIGEAASLSPANGSVEECVR